VNDELVWPVWMTTLSTDCAGTGTGASYERRLSCEATASRASTGSGSVYTCAAGGCRCCNPGGNGQSSSLIEWLEWWSSPTTLLRWIE